MTELIRFQGGSGSPMRIIKSGASQTAPNLDDVLFDANYAPLRLCMLTQGVVFPQKIAAAPPEMASGLRIILPKDFGTKYPICIGVRFVSPTWFNLWYQFASGSSVGAGVATSPTKAYLLNYSNTTTGSAYAVSIAIFHNTVG